MDEMAVYVCFFLFCFFFCYFMDLFIPSGPSLTPSTERSQDFDDQKKKLMAMTINSDTHND